jgi:hypothetical protein
VINKEALDQLLVKVGMALTLEEAGNALRRGLKTNE